ncbi:MAG: alpha/beta fold hydrolase [Nevskia sp.]|nr:alpha/beta fold hydrolase [Nevskia sp.]
MSADAFVAWHAAGRRFVHRGQAIFYREHGAAGAQPALLLIHGFPTASWDWHKLWPALTREFAQVLAPDLIGFGASAKPRRYDYSIFDQADLCEALLRDRGVTRFHVLAHDYGDTVAQELLARESERRALGQEGLRLESVCWLNGGLFPETHRARWVQKLLLTPLGPWLARAMNERRFARSFAAVFAPATRPSAAELHEFWQLVQHAGGARIAHRLIRYIPERRDHRSRWVGALVRSPVPLRLVCGGIDPVSGAHMAARYRELVPDADVVLLAQAGHYPQLEAPQDTLAAFLAFQRALGTLKS